MESSRRRLAASQAALAELNRAIDDQVRGAPAWRRPSAVRNVLDMAALAAMRQLLTILNAMLRDQKPWQRA